MHNIHTAFPRAKLRKAFVMAVSPGKADEYFRRHEEMWPELKGALKASGVYNYSLFYYPTTRQVFAYLEIEDEGMWASFADNEAYRRWCEYLSDIIPTNEDRSPTRANLSEVIHLD